MNLEKCYQPNCGGEVDHSELKVQSGLAGYGASYGTGQFYVYCKKCMYKIGAFDTEQQAIAAHNRAFWAVKVADKSIEVDRLVGAIKSTCHRTIPNPTEWDNMQRSRMELVLIKKAYAKAKAEAGTDK